MKKLFILILAICIFSIILCACDNSDYVGGELTQKPLDDNSLSVLLETPPDVYTYDFDSYQELEQALTHKDSIKYSILRAEQGECGTVYQKTLSQFSSGDLKIAVPQIDGNPIALQNKEGYATATLFTSELFNLPWLWYHCVVDDQNIVVKISYLNVVGNFENNSTRYTDILNLIAPGAPSPENYENYVSYEKIYEKQVVLDDDVIVTAMISELKDTSKVFISFYYDGLLVLLHGDKEMLSDDFLQSFSIAVN